MKKHVLIVNILLLAGCCNSSHAQQRLSIFEMILKPSIEAAGRRTSSMQCLLGAQKKYDLGQFYDVGPQVEFCKKNNKWSSFDKEYAYQMMALTSYQVRNMGDAEDYADSLIRLRPTFAITHQFYPQELANLLSRWRTRMHFSFALTSAGYTYTGSGSNSAFSQQYRGNIGAGSEIMFHYDPGPFDMKGLQLLAGVGYQYQQYTYFRSLGASAAFHGDFYRHSLTVPFRVAVNIPLNRSYIFQTVIPSIYGGFVNIIHLNSVVKTNLPYDAKEDVSDIRKKYIPAYEFGYKVYIGSGGSIVFLEFRYTRELRSVIRAETSSQNFFPGNAFIEPQQKWQGLYFCIGGIIKSVPREVR